MFQARIVLPAAGLLAVAWALPAVATCPELVRAMPGDAWVAVLVARSEPADADAAAPPSGALDATAFVFDQVRRMGLVSGADATTAAVMDVIGSLPLVTRHPYAVCVLDGSARAIPGGGHRLDGLRAAVVVQTRGQNSALENRIQHLLNTYANAGVAKIQARTGDDLTSYLLTDQRLPEWACMEWGPVGDMYVLALGQGTFDRMAATIRVEQTSLAEDEWFDRAHQRCRGEAASVEWTVRFASIREQLQPVMAGKPVEVMRALGLADVDRGLWSVGASGRAVEAYAVLRRSGTDDFVRICRPPDGPSADAVVPPEATRYAAIEYGPADLIRRTRDAYLASRSPSAQASLRRMWADVETETGVNAQCDLLDQLGPPILIHDFPRHPLGLPLVRTVVVPISGSAATVQASVDHLLRRFQRHLDRADSGWPLLELHQADDGVWYFQAGLYGPALAVTDRWVVISFSPVAVRQNLAHLQSRPPTTPASESAAAPAGRPGRKCP